MCVKIDIWSDIVCPFCYIGKRHLERALEGFAHRDDVDIVWHSFELDPQAPAELSEGLVDHIAAKYGISREQSQASQEQVAARAAEVGLEFAWREAKPGNTFDAHRLVHLAAQHGLADAAHERFMRAYFTQGLSVADHDTLVRLATEVGLDEAQVREVLAGSTYGDAVRADESQAQAYGITGVPLFVLADKYGISGAQPIEVFEQALDQVWSELHPSPAPTPLTPLGAVSTDAADAPVCGPDGC